MQQLLTLLQRYRHWLLFLVLELVALTLVFSGSVYARSLRWYATSQVVGQLGEWMTELWSYVDLREANSTLLREHAELRQRYSLLERALQDLEAERGLPRLHVGDSLSVSSDAVVVARVVNRPSATGELYFTIDKGAADGIETDMGVMSSTGVVGAVMATSQHYALVIPVVNPQIRLSCTLPREGVGGTLSATTDGRWAALLSGVAPHAHPQPGDTIVTSGYSDLFPEGMMVGRIADARAVTTKGASGAFAGYSVQLATDFEALRYVYVIRTKPSREQRQLEDSISAPQ